MSSGDIDALLGRNWDTSTSCRYNDIRSIEAAFVAGEEEVNVQSGGKSFNLNLKSMHEIR